MHHEPILKIKIVNTKVSFSYVPLKQPFLKNSLVVNRMVMARMKWGFPII